MADGKTRILLVGAGHAHLDILRRLVEERPADLEVTVVSLEARHFYSGMTPGYLAGRYSFEDITSNVPGIAERAGAECIIGGMTRLDPGNRTVTLVDGRALRYDLVSLNIGSLLVGADGPEAALALRIKPLHHAARLKQALEALARGHEPGPARIVVIGAGSGGVEVACAAAAVMDRAGRGREVTLVDGGDGVPAGYDTRFQRRTGRALDQLGIHRRLAVRARFVEERGVRLEDGTVVASDLTIWLTGPQGAPVLAESGLPTDPRGFLWTDGCLRSIADPRLFAVGDCGTPRAHPTLAKSGVYAVREAPILWHNLLATARGRPLTAFAPQWDFLSILNTSDGRALLRYKGLISWSRWAWRLKDRIDRGFMQKYQRLTA